MRRLALKLCTIVVSNVSYRAAHLQATANTILYIDPHCPIHGEQERTGIYGMFGKANLHQRIVQKVCIHCATSITQYGQLFYI